MAEPVLFVAGTDPLQDHGGGPTYVRAHARAAAQAGFDPQVFCVSAERGPVVTGFGTVHRVRSPWRRPPPGRGFRHWLAWLHVPLLVAAMARFVRARPRPYLIHAFGHWGAVGVRVARRAGGGHRPVVPVVSVYTTLAHEFAAQVRSVQRAPGRRARAALDLWMIRRLVAGYEREAWQESRLVLVNYGSVGRLLAGGARPARIRRMPYASEAAFVHPPGPEPRPPEATEPEPGAPPLIVSASRHDPRKGVDVLLRALARLRAAGVPFRACLVGGWGLLEPHRRLAGRLGLGPETRLTGYVPDAYPYLSRADVFVLPSLQEASGSLALLEALQAGVAVVASAVDGVPEDVTDGESALLVPPGDPEALATALVRLLQDRTLRARLTGNGQAVFRARFTAAGLTGALRDLYGELGFPAGG